MKWNLATVGTLIAILAGLGTIIAGVGFVLNIFYVSRAEYNIAQQAYIGTLGKLDNLETSLTNLTKIFLRGEINSLKRVIKELEAIENRTDAENDYLFRLNNDITDLQNQLNALL